MGFTAETVTPASGSASETRSLARRLEPLELLAGNSRGLVAHQGARFVCRGQEYEMPCFRYIGPKGGDEPIRLGLFAGIHGDEPEGIHALISFLASLEREPEAVAGYDLFVYPICNPTGYEDRTRHCREGRDLNREFWRGSSLPEVRWLETELMAHSFQGIISLHTDDTSPGFYGYAHGATLTRNLIEPALRAAAQFLPLNASEIIDGFPACNGIIRDTFPGVLCAPAHVRPRPFEIILETPQSPPDYLKEAALVAALRAILVEYRRFIAYAPNL